MWTGLDQTEQAYLGLVWGERDTQIRVPLSVPVRPSVCLSGNIVFLGGLTVVTFSLTLT